ncbi:MAG: hypothetical protein MJB14_17920 [Spirochaetes bacterium]|nr:hypothetical protein [Spirochaetota bacterium]
MKRKKDYFSNHLLSYYQTRSFLSFVSDLKAIACTDMRIIESNRQSFNIAEMLDNILHHIQHELTLKNIKVNTSLPIRQINGHPGLINYTFFHLLKKIVSECQSPGEIIIKTMIRNSQLKVELFSDTIFISEPQQKVFFFYPDNVQFEQAVSDLQFRLNLAKKIIEMHQGSICVSSHLRLGTSFCIELYQSY